MNDLLIVGFYLLLFLVTIMLITVLIEGFVYAVCGERLVNRKVGILVDLTLTLVFPLIYLLAGFDWIDSYDSAPQLLSIKNGIGHVAFGLAVIGYFVMRYLRVPMGAGIELLLVLTAILGVGCNLLLIFGTLGELGLIFNLPIIILYMVAVQERHRWYRFRLLRRAASGISGYFNGLLHRYLLTNGVIRLGTVLLSGCGLAAGLLYA